MSFLAELNKVTQWMTCEKAIIEGRKVKITKDTKGNGWNNEGGESLCHMRHWRVRIEPSPPFSFMTNTMEGPLCMLDPKEEC